MGVAGMGGDKSGGEARPLRPIEMAQRPTASGDEGGPGGPLGPTTPSAPGRLGGPSRPQAPGCPWWPCPPAGLRSLRLPGRLRSPSAPRGLQGPGGPGRASLGGRRTKSRTKSGTRTKPKETQPKETKPKKTEATNGRETTLPADENAQRANAKAAAQRPNIRSCPGLGRPNRRPRCRRECPEGERKNRGAETEHSLMSRIRASRSSPSSRREARWRKDESNDAARLLEQREL